MVTSREVLQFPGEHVYPVEPLPVPDLARLAESVSVGAGAGSRYPGLVLFAERPYPKSGWPTMTMPSPPQPRKALPVTSALFSSVSSTP